MNEDTAHMFVSGLVQGVGFRYFVYDKASVFGLKGYVRNLPDGRVEVVIRGERGLILELAGELQRGSESSRVTGVALDWVHSPEVFTGFEIR